jgi:hypothetical protein
MLWLEWSWGSSARSLRKARYMKVRGKLSSDLQRDEHAFIRLLLHQALPFTPTPHSVP